MELAFASRRLQLPDQLRVKLIDFRRRLWTIKLIEALCGAAFGVLLAFLATFALDRVMDTPAGLRFLILVIAVLCCGMVPVALHRWIWQHRRLEQLAILLSHKLPSIGDQLLGIIELSASETEQARSRALCEAAIQHVAHRAAECDFRNAVPRPRHRRWAVLAGTAALGAVILGGLFPAAALNAWSRFLTPWNDIPRYTFAMIEPLPEQLVVAHGEPFTVTVKLSDQTASRPARGKVQMAQQPAIVAALEEGMYQFDLPPQLDPEFLTVRIGDLSTRIRIEPTLRPELTNLTAAFKLPDYLGLVKPQNKDVRGGAISLVKGSVASFTATASRNLSTAQVDGKQATPKGSEFSSLALAVSDSSRMEFRWQDQFGLSGREPFMLSITGRDDEAPSLACEDLPRQRVVLDTELLSFKVRAQDDYGIKSVGIEWNGAEENKAVEKPAKGERILAAGAHDKDSLELAGTFSAQSLGIEPQPVQVRLFAEDYFPNRPRVYSPVYVLYVLNAEQHAIWITAQLSKWHRQSLEVRDREMQLHETNKQLRELSDSELDQPETRRQIEGQSAAERTNGRRLSNLVANGEELVKQASRNPEFGVGHLEKWAEMLQILKDISGNRMPSVADLLKQAAQAPPSSANPTEDSKQTPRMAGQVRTAGGASAEKQPQDKPASKPNDVPSITDIESSQQPLKNEKESPPEEKKSGQPSLGLPQTSLAGGVKQDPNATCPTSQKLDEAIAKQQDLLAEFDKIADELNRVLANLEGSTLVKRLKAESRLQGRVANRIGDQVSDVFGNYRAASTPNTERVFLELSEQERKSSQTVSYIMDDMQGYFDRRRFVQFKTVLDDMRKQDILGSLRQLADEMPKENGVSIAQCEYWSDTLDRWAEDLVDPVSGGT